MATNPNLTYGKVTGFYSRVFVDGTDADTEPETVPHVGMTVLFTPQRKVVVNKTAKATIQIDPFPATTDENGFICTLAGDAGMELPASIDPLINESGWTWNVTLQGGTGNYPYESYDFTLASGQDLDMADVVKVPSNVGTSLLQWAAAVAATSASVEEARALIEAMPAVPTEPSDIGAEPAGLSAATKATQSATFVTPAQQTTAIGEGVSDAATAELAAVAIVSGGASAALMENLERGAVSCAVQILFDSTAVGVTRWPYLMAQDLASSYPAFTVRHRLWNDTPQTYDSPTTLQTGPLGDRHAQLVAGQSTWLYMADNAGNRVVGDLDLRVKAAADSWTPAAAMCLASKFNISGTRAWRLTVKTDGKLEFQWSPDGASALYTATSTVAPTVAAGAALYVRAHLAVATGIVTFYTGTDGVAWTILGTAVTVGSGATSIFAAQYRIEVGGRSNGSDLFVGKIYEVQIRNGLNGPLVAPANIESYAEETNAAGKVTWGGSPVLEIINGGKSGANIAYLNDATRAPKMLPDFGTLLTFLGSSHNDARRLGPQYLADWDSLLATVRSRLPMSAVVAVGQNPRSTPADVIRQHAGRIAQINGWASRNGIGYLNVYKAFLDHIEANPGVTIESLLDVLGIHPADAAYTSIYYPAVKSMLERHA